MTSAGRGVVTAPAPRVVAVVVTFNRRELLERSLTAVLAQSTVPDRVIVVDNASTDGTAAAVRERFPTVRLLALTVNTGGAGGFAAGIEAALADDAELIWLMDDDTVPVPDALAELLRARAAYPGPVPTLLASRVLWTDGRDHPMNTPRAKPFARSGAWEAAAAVGCIPIRSASFVSLLVDARACAERGLPVADYFLWNDDFEFTTRLVRGRVGLLCRSSVVVHHTRTFGSTDADPGDRFYFEVRNKVWLMTRSSGLGPVERVLYGGSTLRRWTRTIARSQQRPALWRAMRRGLIDGVRRPPRANDVVLQAALPSGKSE